MAFTMTIVFTKSINGVVNVEGLEHVESEYRSDIKHSHPTQRFTKLPMKAMIHSKMIDTLFTK
jgi:hypothetical protein